VAGAELQKHVFEQSVDLPATQTADPVDDAADSRLAARIEEPGNTRRISLVRVTGSRRTFSASRLPLRLRTRHGTDLPSLGRRHASCACVFGGTGQVPR
jgi:hypothetical protein